MAQGVLPCRYQEEPRKSGATALAGLPLCLDLAVVAGLRESIERRWFRPAPRQSKIWTVLDVQTTQ
jgi:hypothetical protein